MDIYHNWGEDLVWSASGDLLEVSGSLEGRQRVLRRLLTVEGTYIWAPTYGAGLPLMVGRPIVAQEIEVVARRQMFLERAVSSDPFPQVQATKTALGVVTLNIAYVDADTAEPVAIGFTMKDT